MASTRYYKIQLRVSEFEFKKFKKIKDDYGLSAREVLEIASSPNHLDKQCFRKILDDGGELVIPISELRIISIKK